MKTEFKVRFIKKTKMDEEFFEVDMKDYRGSQTYKLEKSQIRHLIETLDNAIL